MLCSLLRRLNPALALLAGGLLTAWQGQPPATPQAFDVASIKPCGPDGLLEGTGLAGRTTQMVEWRLRDAASVGITGNRFRALNTSLAGLIAYAFRIPKERVLGPRWLDADRFNVEAKLPDGSGRETAPEMLRTLLSERFRVVARTQQKEALVYALTVGPKSLALKTTKDPQARASCRTRLCGGLSCTNTTLKQLAQRLSRPSEMDLFGLEVPVVDITGLDTKYDIDLDFDYTVIAEPDDGSQCTVVGRSVSTALRNVGLTLKRLSQMQDFVIVESVQREPVPN